MCASYGQSVGSPLSRVAFVCVGLSCCFDCMFYVSHRNNKYVSHCCSASVCLPDHSCGHVEILSTSRVKC